MAYIKNIKITQTVQNCIHYITAPDKTEGGTLVSFGGTAPEAAAMIWQGIRERYGKDSQIKAHHFVQSFDPQHEITPEEAKRIGEEVAKVQFGKYGFEYIVATHVDTDVVHNHILVNSVSTTTGKKYHHNNSQDFKKNPNSYVRLRQLNIDICRSFGIPAFDRPKLDERYEKNRSDGMIAGKYSSTPHYLKTRAYDSWTEKELTNRQKIRADIDEAVRVSDSWDEYLRVMKEKGYEVKWQTKSGEPRKNVTYIMTGARRGRRDDSLNFKNREGGSIDYYSRNAILKRIKRLSGDRDICAVQRAGGVTKSKYKRVQIKGNFFRGYCYGGIRYLCHPKYRIMRRKGRVYYIKRDAVETWYIKRFLKMPEELTPIGRKFGGSSGRLSPGEEKRIREEIDSTIRRCGLISRYKIASADDAEKTRQEFVIHYQSLQGQFEILKREIAESDRFNDLADIVEELRVIGMQYDSLTDEKEKTEFYFHNKYNIQRYKYAWRELNRAGYDTEGSFSVREERDRLYERMKTLTEEQKICEINISDVEKIKEQIKGIHSGGFRKEVDAKEPEKMR